jgi:iron complex outermembrane receptor protein
MVRMDLRRGLLCASAAGLLATPAAAFAQKAATGAATTSGQIEEVIVTARKRDEAISKTPEAVTAVTAQMIEKQSIQNLDDVRNITPGLVTISSPIFHGTLANFIRGIGETATDQSADPVIATYVNGVYMPSGTVAVFNLFDVSHVEVLRGSQGTLFGKNTTAGAVVIRTKDPGDKTAAELNVEGGSYGLQQYTGAVDVPLAAGLAVRLSAGHKESDGDWINGLNGSRAGGENVSFGRMTLRYQPGGPLDARVVLEVMNDASDTPGVQTTAAPGILSTLRLATLPAPAIPYGSNRPGLVYNPADANGGNRTDQQIASVEINYDIADLGRLTSITGYYRTDARQLVGNSGVPSHFLDYNRRVRRNQGSEELRFAQTLFGKLDLVSGVYGSSSFAEDGNLISGELLAGPPFTAVASQPAFKFKQLDLSAAGFMDGIYHVTDRLRLDLGFRYSWERKRFQDGANCGVDANPGQFQACARVFNRAATWTSFDPKIGLDFDLTPTTLVYAKYTTGFRSGGFNGRSAIGDLGPYAPETVRDVEVGLKGKALDNRLAYSLVGFWDKYKDLQIQFVRRSPNPFVGPAIVNDTIVRNAASETTKGVEFEGEFRITPKFSISGSAAYLDASFGDDFIVDLGAGSLVNLSQNTPRFSPKFTSSLRALYEEDFGGFGSGSLSATVSTSSSYQVYVNLAPGDLAFSRENGYVRWDAVAAWTSPSERYRVHLVGRNLSNERYLIYGNQSPGAVQFVGSAPGRTFYVELGVRF